MRRALGKTPGDAFLKVYIKAISSYVAYAAEEERVSPGKVLDRLKNVCDCGKDLFRAIEDLRLTDQCYIGKFFTRKWLQEKDAVSEDQLIIALGLFLDDVDGAYKELEASQRKGALPAFPKQLLALSISYALYSEDGKFPPLTRGKTFDLVLKAALEAGDTRCQKVRRRDRSDVMPLMQFAKANFEVEAANQFIAMVNSTG